MSAADRAVFLQTLAAAFQDTDFHHLTPEEASELSSTVIRSCLGQGVAEHIQYRTPGAPAGGAGAPATHSRPAPMRPAPAAPAPHIGRNDPCPCGSGKKFKHCCGRR
jgi:preprotein translocase subunit SecA